MRLIRRPMLGVAIAVLSFVAAGCYTVQANVAADNGWPVPWFCNPVAENSVTGPGMGPIDYYAGVTRGPLPYDECKQVGTILDQARHYAEQYPTLGDARAVGMRNGFNFIPGMGTHTGFGFDPAMLADPSFDPQNPVFPGTNVDDVFDPASPEFLQYNGNTDDSVLVGADYYVRTDTGLPPEGLPGQNDFWHIHSTLCANTTTGTAFAVNTTDQACATQGGINLHMQNYYMLHVWVVEDLEYYADLHAPMHPCIEAGGAIFDMSDPCHQDFVPASAASGASLGASSVLTENATRDEHFFCPIGRLDASLD